MADLKFLGYNVPAQKNPRQANPLLDALVVNVIKTSNNAAFQVIPLSAVPGSSPVLEAQDGNGNTRFSLLSNGQLNLNRTWQSNGVDYSYSTAFNLDPAGSPAFGSDGTVQLLVGTGTADPTFTGVPAPSGSLLIDIGGTLWIKGVGGNSDWSPVGSGGGGGSLQDAYDNGRTIDASPGSIDISDPTRTTGNLLSLDATNVARVDPLLYVRSPASQPHALILLSDIGGNKLALHADSIRGATSILLRPNDGFFNVTVQGANDGGGNVSVLGGTGVGANNGGDVILSAGNSGAGNPGRIRIAEGQEGNIESGNLTDGTPWLHRGVFTMRRTQLFGSAPNRYGRFASAVGVDSAKNHNFYVSEVSPEGLIGAEVGSQCIVAYPSANANDGLWVKESGSSITGWVHVGAGGGSGDPVWAAYAPGTALLIQPPDAGTLIGIVSANGELLTAEAGRGVGGAPGDLVLSGGILESGSPLGGAAYLRGGNALAGSSGAGGDVYLDGGSSADALPGQVHIGTLNAVRISSGNIGVDSRGSLWQHRGLFALTSIGDSSDIIGPIGPDVGYIYTREDDGGTDEVELFYCGPNGEVQLTPTPQAPLPAGSSPSGSTVGLSGNNLAGARIAQFFLSPPPGEPTSPDREGAYYLHFDNGVDSEDVLVIGRAGGIRYLATPLQNSYLAGSATVEFAGFAFTPPIGLVGAGLARIPTPDEKQAMIGTTFDPPSRDNPFVTDIDGRLTNARTPIAHAASHLPGGSDPLESVVLDTDTSRNVTNDDHRKTVQFNSGSTITVNVPSGLQPGTTVEYVQLGTGQVQAVAGGGMTLVYPASFLPNTNEQFSSLVVTILTSSTALVRGDLEAV